MPGALWLPIVLVAALRPFPLAAQAVVSETCAEEISTQAVSTAAITAEQVVNCANKLLRGSTSHSRVSMTVERPEWKRTLDIESWNRGRDRALIVVHAPVKDKGTATLRVGPEMWLWMPRVERVVKVPPTMMHSSWMGSNFTYEDIVKADSILKDYTHKVSTRKKEKDYELVTVEALPKPEAPVVWGRVLITAKVYPNGYVIPLREEDYSERGELIRTIRLSEVEVLGGKTVPTRLECVPEKKKDERTVVKYLRIDFDVDVPDSTFSLERLQKQR